MKLIEFPEQTVVIAKDNPNYKPLPAHVAKDDPHGTVTCCWKLTFKERVKLLLTGKLWHQILLCGSSHLQPQLMHVDKPALSEYDDNQTELPLKEYKLLFQEEKEVAGACREFGRKLEEKTGYPKNRFTELAELEDPDNPERLAYVLGHFRLSWSIEEPYWKLEEEV